MRYSLNRRYRSYKPLRLRWSKAVSSARSRWILTRKSYLRLALTGRLKLTNITAPIRWFAGWSIIEETRIM